MKIIKKNKSINTLMNKHWLNNAGLMHFWIIWRFAVLKSLLKKAKINIKNAKNIMDLGCGNGVLSNQIEDTWGIKIDRVDSNYTTLKLNKNVKGKLICYNISKKNLNLKNKYNVIFLFDVLEHIKNDKLFLNHVSFHLKKGGYLIINVPSINSLFSKYDFAVGHIRRYDRPSLKKKINLNFYKIRNIEYWGFLLVPVLFLRKFFSIFYKKNKFDKIVKLGWKVKPLTNKIFKFIMNCELNMISNPPIGSSIMVILQKK